LTMEIKEKKIVLTDQTRKERAKVVIDNCPQEPVWEVVIKPFRKDRSKSQNALYWKWLTIIAEELGMTKEELHEQCKHRHLVPILIRDDEAYAAMVQAVQDVREKGMKEQADRLSSQIIRLTSTTDLNTKQMAEYMDQIKIEMAGLGIVLPEPEDMYN